MKRETGRGGDGWCREGEPEQLDERRITANELVQTCRALRFDIGHLLAHHQASNVPGRRAGDVEEDHVLPIGGESETELWERGPLQRNRPNSPSQSDPLCGGGFLDLRSFGRTSVGFIALWRTTHSMPRSPTRNQAGSMMEKSAR